MRVTGAAVVAGVVGAPVTHSLSPLIHGAWIEAARLDAVYAPFAAKTEDFGLFVRSLRGGVIRGLNVTVPFKERALELATRASDRAKRAGAANLLIFEPTGAIVADNTDGAGMLAALAEQAPGFDVTSGPAVMLGAGGAARGAAAALVDAGVPEVRIVNRTHARAEALAEATGARAMALDSAAFDGAALIVNATTLGLGGGAGPAAAFQVAASGAVALDMVYRPLRTEFLERAGRAGLATVDGLAMLIGQAVPSFEAFFGQAPPDIDVRSLCLAALGETA
ncbi:MAG TPA: shikimate dehydrogenase [Caulobacteraceae bacterium]|jgi:shikimate dehydrogenase|nr:shikimate dehydrogenase [Caulobacteraceae bacterium]